MKKWNIPNLKEIRQFEDIKYVRKDGSKYWSVRELADVLDYSWWRNFQKVIARAMIVCELSLVTISKIHRQIFMLLQNKALPYFLLCVKVIL